MVPVEEKISVEEPKKLLLDEVGDVKVEGASSGFGLRLPFSMHWG